MTDAPKEMIARKMVRCGELVLIEESGQLIPGYQWQITGGYLPAEWNYQITLGVPTNNRNPGRKKIIVYKIGNEVFHFRQRCLPLMPWKGNSALALAKATTTLATEIERQLTERAQIPYVGAFGLSSVGGDDLTPEQQKQILDSYQNLSEDLKKQTGKLAILPVGRGGTPLQSVGSIQPGQFHEGRQVVNMDLLEMMGIPSGLFGNSGMGTREAFRQLLHLTLEPMAKLLANEFYHKTDMMLEINFEQLFASDLANQTQALKALIDADVPLQDALEKVGLT